MDAAQIITRARRLTHTNINNYSDAVALEDMDLVYQELIDAIVTEVDEDYYWDVVHTDSVIGQSEYKIIQIGTGASALDIKKVNRVYIKYADTDELYTPAQFLNPTSLEFATEFYEANQPSSKPFFYFQDTSVWIYPAPTAVVVKGIRITPIHVPPVLTLTSTADDIEIPVQFHKVISTGMKQYIYGGQGKINEKNDAVNDFQREKEKMVTFIKDRYNEPGESVEPNLTILE